MSGLFIHPSTMSVQVDRRGPRDPGLNGVYEAYRYLRALGRLDPRPVEDIPVTTAVRLIRG